MGPTRPLRGAPNGLRTVGLPRPDPPARPWPAGRGGLAGRPSCPGSYSRAADQPRPLLPGPVHTTRPSPSTANKGAHMFKTTTIAAIAAVAALGLSACDVKKTQEGSVTVPKYDVKKTEEGNVT